MTSDSIVIIPTYNEKGEYREDNPSGIPIGETFSHSGN